MKLNNRYRYHFLQFFFSTQQIAQVQYPPRDIVNQMLKGINPKNTFEYTCEEVWSNPWRMEYIGQSVIQ